MTEAEALDAVADKAMCGQPIFIGTDVGMRPHKGVAVSRIDIGKDGHLKSMEVHYNIGGQIYKTTLTPGVIIGM